MAIKGDQPVTDVRVREGKVRRLQDVAFSDGLLLGHRGCDRLTGVDDLVRRMGEDRIGHGEILLFEGIVVSACG